MFTEMGHSIELPCMILVYCQMNQTNSSRLRRSEIRFLCSTVFDAHTSHTSARCRRTIGPKPGMRWPRDMA